MSAARITAKARADLDELWFYVSADDPTAADRLIDRLIAACLFLAEAPMAGRDRSDLRAGMRSFRVGNYLVFYAPAESSVEIIRVVSGHRDLPTLFDE